MDRAATVRISDWNSFTAGLLFLVIGGGAAFVVSGYRMGSALHMGPGYYPFAVALLLALAGLAAMLRALVVRGVPAGALAFRPALFITVSVLVFGTLIDRIGLVPTAMLLVVLSAMAARPLRIVQTGLLAVIMAACAAGIFVYGLKLPFSLFG